MKQSHSIKREIDELEKRHEQLARELSKAIQANSEAQAELVKTGSDEAMRQAATAFASFSSLKQAVEMIDKQLEEKRQQLVEAQEYEGLAATRARVAECEKEIEAVEQEYKRGRLQAHQALQEILPAVYAASKKYRALWREVRDLDPPAPGTKYRDYIPLEQLEPFGHLVDQALQVLANVDARGTHAERKAKAQELSKRIKQGERNREEARKARAVESSVR